VGDRILRAIIAGDDDAYGRVVADQAKNVISNTKLPKPGGGAWSENDAWSLASEFFTKKKSVQTTLIAATDDDSLNGYVYTALENQIRQKLRGSTKARLKRRLKELLDEEGWVEEPEGFWRRPERPPDAFGGRDADLEAATWDVDVQLSKWRDDAKRNKPFAERASLVRLLDAIGSAAGGAVHIDTITNVVARRLGLSSLPTVEPLDLSDEGNDLADPDPGPEAELEAQDDAIEAAATAVSVYGDLSPDQRRMIPFAHDSVRKAGEQLGWGKTKADRVQKRLEATYKSELANLDDDQRQAVLDELAELERPRMTDLDGSGEDR
jgi:hypothetical protein